MNRCKVIMLMSGIAAWVHIALALITNNMIWLFLAVAMFAICEIADRVDDKIRARIRRFE